MSFRVKARSAGQEAPGGAVFGIGAEPGGREAREAAQAEARRIASRRRVAVARRLGQLGQPRVARLGVEAVAVLPGDRRHARAEATDDDGWSGVGAEITLRPVEPVVRAREGRGGAGAEAPQDLG